MDNQQVKMKIYYDLGWSQYFAELPYHNKFKGNEGEFFRLGYDQAKEYDFKLKQTKIIGE